MASLSEEMKKRREMKRRLSVLSVDGDLGNIGLYKSALSSEYDLDCINTISIALNMCANKGYDVILIDGMLGIEKIKGFIYKVEELYGSDKVMIFVLAEPDQKEIIIKAMCKGAYGYIPKPFTKEGIASIIYNACKKQREERLKRKILVIDSDELFLKDMKRLLNNSYRINIMNSSKIALDFIRVNKPDLVIMDMNQPYISGADIYEKIKEDSTLSNVKFLFTTHIPDVESIERCAKLQPEGIITKPIDEKGFVSDIDEIFMRSEYIN